MILNEKTSSYGGTAKTTSEMKTQSTFTNWDFDSTWSISSQANEGYPYLQSVSNLVTLIIPLTTGEFVHKHEVIEENTKTLEGLVYILSYQINTIGNLKPGVGYRVYVISSDTLVYQGN